MLSAPQPDISYEVVYDVTQDSRVGLVRWKEEEEEGVSQRALTSYEAHKHTDLAQAGVAYRIMKAVWALIIFGASERGIEAVFEANDELPD